MIERREIWDEFRWEDFMLERDKKVERAMELLYRERPVADASGWSWLMGELPEIDDDDTDDGEEWKCETLQPWRLAQDFAAHALKVVESMAERPKSESGTGSGADSAVVDFVSNAMIAPGTIARGMSFGCEPEGGGQHRLLQTRSCRGQFGNQRPPRNEAERDPGGNGVSRPRGRGRRGAGRHCTTRRRAARSVLAQSGLSCETWGDTRFESFLLKTKRN